MHAMAVLQPIVSPQSRQTPTTHPHIAMIAKELSICNVIPVYRPKIGQGQGQGQPIVSPRNRQNPTTHPHIAMIAKELSICNVIPVYRPKIDQGQSQGQGQGQASARARARVGRPDMGRRPARPRDGHYSIEFE